MRAPLPKDIRDRTRPASTRIIPLPPAQPTRQKPKRVPVVMTREEVKAVLNQLTGDKRLMASLMYGAGLRLMECLRLRKILQCTCRLAPAVGLSAGETLEEPPNRRAGSASRRRIAGTEGREKCRCQSGAEKTRIKSYVPLFVRNSLAGGRLRHPDGTGMM